MEKLLLTFLDVAQVISFREATIQNWAYCRKPAPPGFPLPIRVGRLLRYRSADLEDWVEAQAGGNPNHQKSDSNFQESQEKPKRLRGRPRLVDGGNHG